MKILNVAGALACPLILMGAIAAMPTTVSAGGKTLPTCASAASGLLVDGHTTVVLSLVAGDQLTIVEDPQNVAFFDVIDFSNQPGAGSLTRTGVSGPVVINVVAPAVVEISVANGVGSGTVTCVPGGTLELNAAAVEEVAPSTEDVQNAFSAPMMMSHLGALYDDVHRNTAGVLNGNGNQSITQNDLFLQSAGKASKDIPGVQPTLNVFVAADVTSFDGDSFDGLTGNLTIGMDYRVSRDVVVGALVSGGRADFSTLVGTNVGSLENTGYTVGLYGAAKVFGDVTIDGLLTYSGLDYDVANGGTTGDFDANRFGISVGIYNQMPFMGAIIEPHARVVYGIEEQDSYTDSVGRAVGSNTVNAGRIILGPRLIAPTINGFTPWISANGVYEFSDSGNLATGAPDFDDTFSGRVGLGFDWDSDLGLIGGEVEFGGLGADTYNSVGGSVKYTLQF